MIGFITAIAILIGMAALLAFILKRDMRSVAGAIIVAFCASAIFMVTTDRLGGEFNGQAFLIILMGVIICCLFIAKNLTVRIFKDDETADTDSMSTFSD